jgi:hypothetical protein
MAMGGLREGEIARASKGSLKFVYQFTIIAQRLIKDNNLEMVVLA